MQSTVPMGPKKVLDANFFVRTLITLICIEPPFQNGYWQRMNVSLVMLPKHTRDRSRNEYTYSFVFESDLV